MGRGTWRERWATLRKNLAKPEDLSEHSGDEDDIIGAQLDIGGHSQDVSEARFSDKDLVSQGGLPGGQFGEIDVALCRLDNALYVRKAQPRRQALQATRERDVLLRARRTESVWSPHLLCAFKEGTGCGYDSSDGPLSYTLVMSYVPGGTLEDVLESCTVGGLAESDVRWWFSQAVCAIGWLHDQGWAHRDIKPSNLAITSTKHLQVLDFGCAAPISLSTSRKPGSAPVRVLPYDDCLVPCGTCDYLSPEILIWHENALARAREGYEDEEEEEDTWAQDFSEDIRSKVIDKLKRSVNGQEAGKGDTSGIQEGYGPETDWWSLSAMVYELAYGVAPFFAPDVPTTYKKVLSHSKSLRFPAGVASSGLEAVLGRMLTSADQRLGRYSVKDIQNHEYFRGVDWENLHILPAPTSLVTPQFTYAPPVLDESAADISQEHGGGGFAFSAFFQSTVDESNMVGFGGETTNGVARNRAEERSQRANEDSRKLTLRPARGTADDDGDDELMEQLGTFSWGPSADAFDHAEAENTIEDDEVTEDVGGLMAGTPFRLKVPVTPYNKPTPFRQPLFGLPSATPLRQTSATPFRKALATPFQYKHPTVTPFRQNAATSFYQTAGSHGRVAATPFRQPVATPFRPAATGPDHTYRGSAHLFKTPVRPGALAYNQGAAGFGTGNTGRSGAVPPGTSTARRTRTVTEAEALRQVLESARKRVYLGGEDSKSSQSTLEASARSLYAPDETYKSNSNTKVDPSSVYEEHQSEEEQQAAARAARPSLYPIMIPMLDVSLSSSDGLPGPISPSPSPRPGSALSRRSATPSAMMTFGAVTPSAMYSRSASRLSLRANTPTWGGRSARRDESEDDTLEERKEMERERREKGERLRRAILEKEKERARKEELARLERQKEKGKGRERDVEPAEVRGMEGLSSKSVKGQSNRQSERPEQRKKLGPSDQRLAGKAAAEEGRQASDRTILERQAQAKLEQERQRLEKKKEARSKAQQDQEVEAARMHELALAEKMAQRDEERQVPRPRSRVHSSEGGNGVPVIRVDRTGDRAKEDRKAVASQLGSGTESTVRRRVKSVDEALVQINSRQPQSMAQLGRLESREGKQSSLAPAPRARTRSHEPLRPSAAEPEKSRSALDDISARQQDLLQDVDALQKRINEALRMLQSN